MIVRRKGYAGIPRYVMNSPEYKKLSGSAAKLLQEFCYQLTKDNNGDLTCAFSVLKHRGWNSRATIERARDELIEADLVQKTREGKFTNPGGVCALYGVTWYPVFDAPGKNLDVRPTSQPKRSQPSWEQNALPQT